MAGRDRRLQRIGPERIALRPGPRQRREAAADQELVPARAVLVEEEHGLAARIDACPQARGLDLHQRNEAVHFGLLRHELGQDAAQAQGVLAQRGTRPVLPRRRGVPLVEHEIDHLEHRRQPVRELARPRHLERHARLGERALGAHDALRDRGLGHEEGAGDLVGGEAAQQLQRERHARIGGQHGMARGEHEAQQVVADVVRKMGIHTWLRIREERLDLPRELRFLLRVELALAEAVERAMLRGGHEPGARVVGNAARGPGFERRHQRVLRELLGGADVAHHPRHTGDDARRFDPVDGLDGLQCPARGGVRHEGQPPGRTCIAGRPRTASRTACGKSSTSCTWRTSMTSSSLAGQREAHAMASSRDFTSMSQ